MPHRTLNGMSETVSFRTSRTERKLTKIFVQLAALGVALDNGHAPGNEDKNNGRNSLSGTSRHARRGWSPFQELVRPAGIEPATCGFEARRSIQLSYGRTKLFEAL